MSKAAFSRKRLQGVQPLLDALRRGRCWLGRWGGWLGRRLLQWPGCSWHRSCCAAAVCWAAAQHAQQRIQVRILSTCPCCWRLWLRQTPSNCWGRNRRRWRCCCRRHCWRPHQWHRCQAAPSPGCGRDKRGSYGGRKGRARSPPCGGSREDRWQRGGRSCRCRHSCCRRRSHWLRGDKRRPAPCRRRGRPRCQPRRRKCRRQCGCSHAAAAGVATTTLAAAAEARAAAAC
jgi:hypothetical protein